VNFRRDLTQPAAILKELRRSRIYPQTRMRSGASVQGRYAFRVRHRGCSLPQNAGYNPTGTVAALAYWSVEAIRNRYLKSLGPQVAAVVTYVRNSWGHAAAATSPGEVRKARQDLQARVEPESR
jgi:hypothetical protein